jgi:hypothetical protein
MNFAVILHEHAVRPVTASTGRTLPMMKLQAQTEAFSGVVKF